ncbi:MAG: hypothetical protein AB9897_02020 [Anaerolineaceae bacterium]
MVKKAEIIQHSPNIAMKRDQEKVEKCQMPEFEVVVNWIEKITPDSQPLKMSVQVHHFAQSQYK